MSEARIEVEREEVIETAKVLSDDGQSFCQSKSHQLFRRLQ